MKVRAWISDDGQTVQTRQHDSWKGLSAWWRRLPKLVGVMVLFSDGTRHSMEASEYYAVSPRGRGRKRFWNGDCYACVPEGAHAIRGIEIPDDIYEAASVEMGNWYA